MNTISKWAMAIATVLVCTAITTQPARAVTFTVLYSFGGGPDGNGPNELIQATNGDFYGTTFASGANGYGTVFKITPSGKLTTLYSFCSQTNCTDGANPLTGLIQSTNGDFYGVTQAGGSCCGTVFKITPSGTFTTIYNFCSQTNCTDGEDPYGGLIQPTEGDLYGTITGGGTGTEGTVFKITPGGTLTTLYSFCANGAPPDCTDGANPWGALIQASNGDFYGTTDGGGANGDYGTVWISTGQRQEAAPAQAPAII